MGKSATGSAQEGGAPFSLRKKPQSAIGVIEQKPAHPRLAEKRETHRVLKAVLQKRECRFKNGNSNEGPRQYADAPADVDKFPHAYKRVEKQENKRKMHEAEVLQRIPF